MIGLNVKIVKTDDKLSQRRFNAACKEGFAAVGQEWHAKMLPDHFEAGNWRRYRHEPRTKKYRERKQRLAAKGQVAKRGEVDLVYSGAMEQTMERFATIRPFPTRATVRVQAPRYMTLKPRGNQPNKFAELSRTTPQQMRKLESTLKRTIEAAVQR